jgi:hypothetical protein
MDIQMNIIKVKIGPYGIPTRVCLLEETTNQMHIGWFEDGTNDIIFRHWYDKDIIEIFP